MDNRIHLNMPKSNLEKILEGISILEVIAACTYLAIVWTRIPDKIPTHFDFSGKVDSFGGKGSLFIFLVIMFILYIILTIVSKFPQHYNYVVKITNENAERQYQNAHTLMVWLKVEITSTLLFIEWKNIQVAMSNANGLGLLFLPVFFIVLFGTLGFYISRMLKLK